MAANPGATGAGVRIQLVEGDLERVGNEVERSSLRQAGGVRTVGRQPIVGGLKHVGERQPVFARMKEFQVETRVADVGKLVAFARLQDDEVGIADLPYWGERDHGEDALPMHSAARVTPEELLGKAADGATFFIEGPPRCPAFVDPVGVRGNEEHW